MNWRDLFKPRPLAVEPWALRASEVSSPDEIIAASIIQSFAKDFDSWDCPNFGYTNNRSRIITHRTNKTEINYLLAQSGPYSFSPVIEDKVQGNSLVKVNGVALEKIAGERIIAAYNALRTKHEAAKAAAEEAREAMAANEAKWNLAEKLTGLKRNEQGALVPIKEIAE